MTYPSNFLRLVVSGDLHTSETFSFGISCVPNFPGEDSVPATVPPAIISALTTFWGTAGVTSQAALLRTVKLNEIGPDGRYVDKGNTVLHDFASPYPAGTLAVKYPAQVALAVSLRTARTRGRAHAGRFYLPSPVLTMQPDGTVAAANALEVANATKTFLNAVNAALPGYRVGVASNVGTGDFEIVTGVTVGRTFDTIRSRRTSLLENYPDPVALTA